MSKRFEAIPFILMAAATLRGSGEAVHATEGGTTISISAAVLVAVSEISKRSKLLGGLIASLPLASLLAFIWLWRDTHDAPKIAALSTSIVWLVLPSLVLFVVLPVLLKRGVMFWPSFGMSIVAMRASYGLMLFGPGKFGIKL